MAMGNSFGRARPACLWLILAAILAHAVVPVGSPLARTQGSAFSIATTDVSLAASRKKSLRRNVAAAVPANREHGLPPEGEPAAIASVDPSDPSRIFAWKARGPRFGPNPTAARHLLARAHPPRAPPIA